jgi:hypothetical protein
MAINHNNVKIARFPPNPSPDTDTRTPPLDWPKISKVYSTAFLTTKDFHLHFRPTHPLESRPLHDSTQSHGSDSTHRLCESSRLNSSAL